VGIEKTPRMQLTKSLKATYESLAFHYGRKWRDRWKGEREGAHSKTFLPEPSPSATKPHKGMRKFESELLAQLRTGKIGFKSFLYKMKVLGAESPDCDCMQEEMIVEHVLLRCHVWQIERQDLMSPLRTTDLKEILTWNQGCKAAVKIIQHTKLLYQFRYTEEVEEEGKEQ
jgi:hypothetical protein